MKYLKQNQSKSWFTIKYKMGHLQQYEVGYKVYNVKWKVQLQCNLYDTTTIQFLNNFDLVIPYLKKKIFIFEYLSPLLSEQGAHKLVSTPEQNFKTLVSGTC